MPWEELRVSHFAQHLGARGQVSNERIRRVRGEASALAGGDEAGLVGVDHGLDSVAESELAEQV